MHLTCCTLVFCAIKCPMRSFAQLQGQQLQPQSHINDARCYMFMYCTCISLPKGTRNFGMTLGLLGRAWAAHVHAAIALGCACARDTTANQDS